MKITSKYRNISYYIRNFTKDEAPIIYQPSYFCIEVDGFINRKYGH